MPDNPIDLKLQEAILGKIFSSCDELSPCGKLYQRYFVTKFVMTYCEKKCSSDREKLRKTSRLKAENLQSFRDH